MKMFKRVLAAGAALMIAVTGMVMTASAVSEDYNVHYVPIGSVSNVVHDAKYVMVSSTNQKVIISSFYRSNTTGYVEVNNHVSEQLHYIYTSTATPPTVPISSSYVGTSVLVEAKLWNYSNAYCNSTGTFDGVNIP